VYGSIRHHVRLHRSAADVWSLVGDPARLHEWFPGITSCSVDGMDRTIVTGAGMAMPERIVTLDHDQRRFQYEITIPLFRHHRSTVDVIDLGDDTCLVVYAVDADPRTMALVIGGGAAGALGELRRQMEPAPAHGTS
jgi:hypothetical protein